MPERRRHPAALAAASPFCGGRADPGQTLRYDGCSIAPPLCCCRSVLWRATRSRCGIPATSECGAAARLRSLLLLACGAQPCVWHAPCAADAAALPCVLCYAVPRCAVHCSAMPCCVRCRAPPLTTLRCAALYAHAYPCRGQYHPVFWDSHCAVKHKVPSAYTETVEEAVREAGAAAAVAAAATAAAAAAAARCCPTACPLAAAYGLHSAAHVLAYSTST